jgi:hypothetical protein
MQVNKAPLVKLADYLEQRDVTLHPLYVEFCNGTASIPSINKNSLSLCCVRRPVIVIQQPKKRIIIDNHYCFLHARKAMDAGYSDVTIWVHEVKNLPLKDILTRIFLDCLQPCPLRRMRQLYRIQICEKAFERSDFKDIFSIKSIASFSKIFDIAPSLISRNRKLETQERIRLSTGNYKRRGRAIAKIAREIIKCDEKNKETDEEGGRETIVYNEFIQDKLF